MNELPKEHRDMLNKSYASAMRQWVAARQQDPPKTILEIITELGTLGCAAVQSAVVAAMQNDRTTQQYHYGEAAAYQKAVELLQILERRTIVQDCQPENPR